MPVTGWPDGLWEVPYLGSASPGRAPVASWLRGSNCQLFAYGFLSLFGLKCPALPSSTLWADAEATVRVLVPAPLDIILFNKSKDPFGAHLGIWMGPDEVLHLCKEIGRPVVWALEEFSLRPRYATIVGFKRVLQTMAV